MMDENQPRLSDDTAPHMALCQRCTEEFDWRKDTCPHCGWEKDEWASSGRYGLQGTAPGSMEHGSYSDSDSRSA